MSTALRFDGPNFAARVGMIAPFGYRLDASGAVVGLGFFFFKQKTAYEMLLCDWSSDVCSSDLPTRAHGNDGNDGRTPGGWRVQLAEGAHQLDQESQTGGGISRRGARRGAGTVRVEPLVREDGGAKRRSPNRSRAPRARLEELPARRQRTVPGGGELFRDPWGPGGQHPARTGPARAGADPAGDRGAPAVGAQGRQILSSADVRPARRGVRECAPAQGRGDGVRGSRRGRSVPVPPRPVSVGRGAGLARGG